VMAAKMRAAADLGFAAVDIPEEFDGLGLDKTTSALVADHLSMNSSFSTAFRRADRHRHSAAGLVRHRRPEAALPAQARLDGEWMGAYSLSEASSGSDATNVRCRATLSADGAHYILNGEKMWITNCAIADLFTVFAKIDGEKFSAFLVERHIAGPDRRQGGAQARHSRLVDLPAGLFRLPHSRREPAGRGRQGPPHRLQRAEHGPPQAGRCLHRRLARHALAEMVRYAKERTAFGKPIAEFGLIQRKISLSATRLYAAKAWPTAPPA
jgi:alkylation response protein AidB-like acyl-CoA dehydrogenase